MKTQDFIEILIREDLNLESLDTMKAGFYQDWNSEEIANLAFGSTIIRGEFDTDKFYVIIWSDEDDPFTHLPQADVLMYCEEASSYIHCYKLD